MPARNSRDAGVSAFLAESSISGRPPDDSSGAACTAGHDPTSKATATAGRDRIGVMVAGKEKAPVGRYRQGPCQAKRVIKPRGTLLAGGARPITASPEPTV